MTSKETKTSNQNGERVIRRSIVSYIETIELPSKLKEKQTKQNDEKIEVKENKEKQNLKSQVLESDDNDQSNSQKNLIKNVIRKDLSNEAIQAFFKVFFSNHPVINLFWTLSVLVFVGLCSYLIIQSILIYLAYEVSTSTISIVENPADFPKITICK